ncbi:MAG TPA: MFS transporter [Tepidisphaeraceae bacterium]|nr:MFS transporter [Tepidisphaeraceae bacterium]
MLIPLGSTMIAVALPSIGTEFGRAPAELTTWLVTSYLLVSVIGQGPGGKIGDYWGYRRTIFLGQCIFGVGSLLGLLDFFAAVVASRVLMALGGAFMVPTVMAVFKITVPAALRHRVFGYFGAMMTLAAAVGPMLGGVLVHQFGWKSIFLMNLPPLILSALLSKKFFSEHLHEPPTAAFRYDWQGSVLMTCGLTCLVLAFKNRMELMVPAVGFLAAFLWWEGRTAQPLINLKLFSNRFFSAGCAMVALQNLAMYALLFQLPFLLKLLYGWGPERAGPFMTAFMVSMMTASALGGRVAERAGVRATCVMGSIISVAGLYWLSTLAPGEESMHVIWGLVFGGAGLGLANGPSQSAAMSTVDNRQSGIASGVLSTCRYLGGIIGVSILGLLLSTGDAAPTLGDYHMALMIFTGAFVIAASVALRLPGHARPV